MPYLSRKILDRSHSICDIVYIYYFLSCPIFVFDTYIGGSPLIGDENFIKFFQDLVSEYNVDFIYPCMDIVINEFINNEDQFNCKIISSPKETVNICTSKLKTYNEFNESRTTAES